MSLIVWSLSGLISLFGAFSYVSVPTCRVYWQAELGTLIQESGGEFRYLQQTYGDFVGFLYIWLSSLVLRPASGAILVIVFSEYTSKIFIPEGTNLWIVKTSSVIALLFLATVNIVTVKVGTLIQDTSTVFKLSALVIICVSSIFARTESGKANFSGAWKGTSTVPGRYAYAFYQGAVFTCLFPF